MTGRILFNKSTFALMTTTLLLFSVIFAGGVSANIPTVVSLNTTISNHHVRLNINIQHSNPSQDHYIDKIELRNGAIEQISDLASQTNSSFTIMRDLGVIYKTTTVEARAHCTVHGWGAWSTPLTVIPSIQTIQTSKESFTAGEYLQVSGTADPISAISLQVFDPSGNRKGIAQVYSSADGSFVSLKVYKFTSDDPEGTWKVQAYQGGTFFEAEFQVKQAPTPQPTPEKPKVTVARGKAQISIPQVAAGKMATVTIEKSQETSVKTVQISVKNSVNNIQITITKSEEKPASVTVDVKGKVYHYLNIDKQNITDADISSVKISFQVEKSWINTNKIDESAIALQRYEDGRWNKLPTYKINEDAENVYYEAESSSLSIYAISGETVTPTPIASSISLSISATSVNKGQPITVSGAISPPVSGATVHLIYMKAGETKVERTVITASDGSFTDTYVPDAGGSWSIKASWEGDAEHKGAISAPATFEVLDKGCLIATATYGSAMASEVQFLRGFRESVVYQTFAGTSFMSVFNTFYYSWSPTVAAQIWQNGLLQAIGRIMIYPLLAILHLSTLTYITFSFAPEFGIVMAGLVASILIGTIYFVPLTVIALYGYYRRRISSLPKLTRMKLFAAPWLISVALLIFGEIAFSPLLMMVAAATFVVFTITLTTAIIALKVTQHLPK